MLKILVVDNHPVMRLGLRALLDVTGDLRVAGECESGDEALNLVEAAAPDLVALGLNLIADIDGIETCRRIKELPEAPYMLVYTAYNLTDDVRSCLLAGADSYLHKSAGLHELHDAVRRTAAGERVWRIGERAGETRSRIYFTPRQAQLTAREREIMALILRDCPNTEMARKLCLSLPTVKTHVRNVLRKLGVKNRREILRSHPQGVAHT